MESYFMHKDLWTWLKAGLWTKFFTIWSEWSTQQNIEFISLEPKVATDLCHVEQLYELKNQALKTLLFYYILSYTPNPICTQWWHSPIIFFRKHSNIDMHNVVTWCFAPFAKHCKLMNPSALLCSLGQFHHTHTLRFRAHLLGVPLQDLYNIIHWIVFLSYIHLFSK